MNLAEILRRVDLDVDTGCRIWLGALDNGVPVVWIGRKKTPVRRYLLEQLTGEPISDGQRASTTCGRGDCIATDHLCARTASAIIKTLSKAGRMHGPVWRARMTSTRRAQSGKMTLAIAQHIRRRYSAGGIRQSDLALAYGVSESCVCKVLTDRTWRNTSALAMLVEQQLQHGATR